MNIAYLSFLFLCTISSSSNAMEQDIKSGPTLVSNQEAIYFKMPKDMYTTDITSLNLSDKDKSELVKIRSTYHANMKKIEKYIDDQIKKASKSRKFFDTLCACEFYHTERQKLKSSDVDMEYYKLYSLIYFGQCCRPGIEEFFYNKAYVESLLSENPGVTVMSKIEIDEIQKANMKKIQEQIEDALQK